MRPIVTLRAGTIPNGSIPVALKPNLGFAGGPHVCFGMHVARAEMLVAMNAVLDRLPNIRVDPDAPSVRIIGLEHRGPNGVPVVFGRCRPCPIFDGVRVVEPAQFVFVPAWPALLADWGADVVKIEHPVRGDGYRAS